MKPRHHLVESTNRSDREIVRNLPYSDSMHLVISITFVINKILFCISCILTLYSFMRDVCIIYIPPQPRNSNYRNLSTCPRPIFSLRLIHFLLCLLLAHSLHLCQALSFKYTTIKSHKNQNPTVVIHRFSSRHCVYSANTRPPHHPRFTFFLF